MSQFLGKAQKKQNFLQKNQNAVMFFCIYIIKERNQHFNNSIKKTFSPPNWQNMERVGVTLCWENMTSQFAVTERRKTMTRTITERTKTRSYRISARHMISICLALVMFLGSALAYDTAVAFQTQHNSAVEWNSFDEWTLHEELDLPDFQLDHATNFETLASYDEIAFFNEAISENRRNYIKLLEGGYSNYQLRQRFVELFGEGFSGEYIFNNYQSIFDLHDDENIDSAFLRVLSGYQIDFRFQNIGDSNLYNARGVASDDGRVRIFPNSDIMGVSGFTDSNVDDFWLEQIFENMPELQFMSNINYYSFDFDLQSDYYTAFEFEEAENYQMMLHIDYTRNQPIEAFSNRFVTINVVSRTHNSITIDMWFANNTSQNNSIAMRDPATNEWRWIFGQGQPPGRTGRHIITGLSPGVTYFISAHALNYSTRLWEVDITVGVPTLPAPNLVSHSRSSVDFRLDRTFTDALGPTLTNNFLDATNQAFYVIRDFIGGSRFYTGGRMSLEHARDLPRYVEGVAGWPMQWQLYNSYSDWVFFSLDGAQRMRHTNIETDETPIHEIAHNFDSWRWSFEPEAVAVFFTYYYYATTNRRLAVSNQSRTFRGSEFRDFMRNYANRVLGHFNHNEAMRQGVYSCYSMAYSLSRIAAQIGWQPFTDTFIRFHNMELWQVPQTDLEKLNTFLTFLRYYSGDRDVIAMIPQYAIPIYESYFGGRIQYVAVPTPTTITAPTHNQQVPRQNLTITWTAVPNATYVISLRNLTEDRLLLNNAWNANLTSRTILQSNLTAGHKYRIAVGTSRGGRTVWSFRYFSVAGQPQEVPARPEELNITVPFSDGLEFSLRDLYVRWTATSNQGQLLSLRDITTGDNGPLLFNRIDVQGNYFRIPGYRLTAGHKYRIAIAVIINNQERWASRTFYVKQHQAGTVTIRYVNNRQGVTGSVPSPQSGLPINSPTIRTADNRLNLHHPQYILVGWSRSPTPVANATPDFFLGQPNVTITTPGELRLYAHWRPRGWTNTQSVNLRLYHDALFDTNVYGTSATSYRQTLHGITTRAATSFERTFGIVMNVPAANNITSLRSPKNDCTFMEGGDWRFLCFEAHCNGVRRPEPPRDRIRAHSNGTYMLRDVLPQPSSNRGVGLRTMFFAGWVCGNFAGGVSQAIGLAGGVDSNISIASSSSRTGTRAQIERESVRTVIHEWSHNYGVYDSHLHPVRPCLSECIMIHGGWHNVEQDVYNMWCERCRQTILNNRTWH